jgi:RluA family pseudouridine synthase
MLHFSPRPFRLEEDLHVASDYKILYEDDFFLALEKPSPLPVHPGGRFREKNLLSLLQKDYPGKIFYAVNRLDSETSGIVIVAKSPEIAGALGRQFEGRTVKKEYQALVLGVPEPAEGVISQKLGTRKAGNCHLRFPDPAGEEASTLYEVLKSSKGLSKLRVLPLTGRMHQIRAHLSFLGHPVAGDKIYIDPVVFEEYRTLGWQPWMEEVVKFPRLALHAVWMRLVHPVYKEPVEFYSEAPDFIARLD